MARVWNDLSDSYRARLERGGIDREAYESGVSLSAARGHAFTPERPGTGAGQERFQYYYEIRDRVNQLKYDVYGVEPGKGSKDELKGMNRAKLEKAAAYLQAKIDTGLSWDEMTDLYPELAGEEWDFLRHYH